MIDDRLQNPYGKTLSEQMIDDIPVVDLHVHVPGTVTPATAWELGVRNGLIIVEGNHWRDGPGFSNKNPHRHYSDIFAHKDKIVLDAQGKPQNLAYAIDPGRKFKSFDEIMATVQGHRHPPGGIQNENDYKFVMRTYLESCKEQNVFYTELQQNIRIAKALYPGMPEAEARKRFYHLAADLVNEFEEQGVYLRFLHCFNKTGIVPDEKTPTERSIEGALWLKQAKEIVPGVFVGMESAGHEKAIEGQPLQIKEGYDMAAKMGFGCEAHGGEGIGSHHMKDVITTLPISRLAHGFQAIEDSEVISLVRDKGITLMMCPAMNLALDSPVHHKEGRPTSPLQGGEQVLLKNYHDHPFFPMLREHKLKIALSTDNPGMGGATYKTMLKQMAGLTPEHPFADNTPPMTAEELAICSFNAIDAAFCDPKLKQAYVEKLQAWMTKYDVKVGHALLEQAHMAKAVQPAASHADRFIPR